MYLYLVTLIDRLRRDTDGVTLVEYGVAVAFAVGAGGLLVALMGGDFTQALAAAGAAMPDTPAP